METIIGALIVVLFIGGGAVLAVGFIFARAAARAEGEAVVAGRLARYAGSNRE